MAMAIFSIITYDNKERFVPHNSKNVANNGKRGRAHQIAHTDNQNGPNKFHLPVAQFVVVWVIQRHPKRFV